MRRAVELRHTKINLLLGTVVLSLVAASAQAQSDIAIPEADVDAIVKLLEEEFAAANAGDVEALLDLRTDEAVEMLPGDQPLIGKDAIRKAWNQESEIIEQYKNLSIEEINLVGDWAFTRFSYTHSLTPVSGGDPIIQNGQGLLIAQRQPDSSWKIHWEMVNSGEPPN